MRAWCVIYGQWSMLSCVWVCVANVVSICFINSIDTLLDKLTRLMPRLDSPTDSSLRSLIYPITCPPPPENWYPNTCIPPHHSTRNENCPPSSWALSATLSSPLAIAPHADDYSLHIFSTSVPCRIALNYFDRACQELPFSVLVLACVRAFLWRGVLWVRRGSRCASGRFYRPISCQRGEPDYIIIMIIWWWNNNIVSQYYVLSCMACCSSTLIKLLAALAWSAARCARLMNFARLLTHLIRINNHDIIATISIRAICRFMLPL